MGVSPVVALESFLMIVYKSIRPKNIQKTGWPKAMVCNTPIANITWATIPITTSFQLIALLLLLKTQQTRTRKNMPSRPRSRFSDVVFMMVGYRKGNIGKKSTKNQAPSIKKALGTKHQKKHQEPSTKHQKSIKHQASKKAPGTKHQVSNKEEQNSNQK